MCLQEGQLFQRRSVARVWKILSRRCWQLAPAVGRPAKKRKLRGKVSRAKGLFHLCYCYRVGSRRGQGERVRRTGVGFAKAHRAEGLAAVGARAVDGLLVVVAVAVNQPTTCVAWAIDLFLCFVQGRVGKRRSSPSMLAGRAWAKKRKRAQPQNSK